MSNHLTSAAHEGATSPSLFRCWGCGKFALLPRGTQRCRPCAGQATGDALTARQQWVADNVGFPEVLHLVTIARVFGHAPQLAAEAMARWQSEPSERDVHASHVVFSLLRCGDLVEFASPATAEEATQ